MGFFPAGPAHRVEGGNHLYIIKKQSPNPDPHNPVQLHPKHLYETPKCCIIRYFSKDRKIL